MQQLEQANISQFAGYSSKSDVKLPDGIHQIMQNIRIRNGDLEKTDGFVVADLNGVAATLTGLTTPGAFIRFSKDGYWYCYDSGDDKLYVWDNVSAWTEVGSIGSPNQVRYLDRGAWLVMANGSGVSAVPYEYGRSSDRFTSVYSADGTMATEATIAAGYELKPLYSTGASVLSGEVFDNAAWTTAITGKYWRNYIVAFKMIDGTIRFQQSELVNFVGANYSQVRLTIQIDPDDFPLLQSIKVYAADGTEYDNIDDGVYYLIKTIGVNDDVTLYVSCGSATYNTGSGVVTLDTPLSDTEDDQYNNYLGFYNASGAFGYSQITDYVEAAGTFTIDAGLGYGTGAFSVYVGWFVDAVSGDYKFTFEDVINDLSDYETLMANDIGINGSEGLLKLNFGLATFGSGRVFVADVYATNNSVSYSQRIYFSTIIATGESMYGTFLDADYIDIGVYQVGDIVGLVYMQQILYVFCERGVLVLNIGTGSVFTWSLRQLIQLVGAINYESISVIPDGKYAGGIGYVSEDGFRVLYNGYSYHISELIWPIDYTADLANAISFYNNNDREWCVAITNRDIVYCYNLETNGWTTRLLAEVSGVFNLGTEVYIQNSEGFYTFGVARTYGSNSLIPYFMSRTLYFPEVVSIKKLLVDYESDSQFYLDVYGDNSLLNSVLMPVHTSGVASYRVRLPYGQYYSRLYFVIRMIAAQAALNTTFKLSSIAFKFSVRGVYA